MARFVDRLAVNTMEPADTVHATVEPVTWHRIKGIRLAEDGDGANSGDSPKSASMRR